MEATLPDMYSAGGGADVDIVLTTREFARLVRAEHIAPALLTEEAFDSPLGESTGAGVIFGVTGGVMEAALRTATTVWRASILRRIHFPMSEALKAAGRRSFLWEEGRCAHVR